MKESLSPWILPFLCWRATNCFPRTDIRLDCLSLSLSGCNLYLTLKMAMLLPIVGGNQVFQNCFLEKMKNILQSQCFWLQNHTAYLTLVLRVFPSDSIINRSYWGPESNSNGRVIKRRIAYLRLKKNVEHYFLFLVGCGSEPIKQS